MKIEVIRRIDQPEQVEVDFPLFTHTSYHFDEGNGYDTLQRIEADGTCFSVTKNYGRYGEIDFEFGVEEINLARDLAAYFTKDAWNERLSTEADFLKAVEEARTELRKFPA